MTRKNLNKLTAFKNESDQICLLFSEKDNSDIYEFDSLKDEIYRIPFVLYCCETCEEDGYLVILPLKYPAEYSRQYEAAIIFFAAIGLKADRTCSDKGHIFHVSHDAQPYINQDAQLFDFLTDDKWKPYQSEEQPLEIINDDLEQVEQAEQEEEQEEHGQQEAEHEQHGQMTIVARSPIYEVKPLDICSLEECFSILSNNRQWIERFVMNMRSSGNPSFSIENFRECLVKFFRKLSNEGITEKSPKEAMAHFARWLNIEIEKSKHHRTTKEEANQYAMKQFINYVQTPADNGEKPF